MSEYQISHLADAKCQRFAELHDSCIARSFRASMHLDTKAAQLLIPETVDSPGEMVAVSW
jgi:hypothetical protein